MKSLHALFQFLVFGLLLFVDPPAGGGDGGTPPPASGGTPPPASGGTPPAGGAGGTPPPASGTPPPADGPLIGADGKFGPGFAKAYPSLAGKFTEPGALVGSYVNLEKMISAKGIIKPGPAATPAELDAYYTQLGRPATAKDYGLAKPEKMSIDGKDVAVPNELWEAETASKASELFHKLGLTKEQASALTAFDLERGLRAKGSVDGMLTQSREQCIAELKTQWPGANYERNINAARDAATKAGLPPELLNANPHIANDPNFIKAFFKVSQMITEGPSSGVRQGGDVTRNPVAEIAAIMADKTHAWHAENAAANPKAHTDAVKHMRYLYQLKHGEV